MQQREELVWRVERGELSVAELCRRFEVSRPTAYRWLERYRAEGAAGLADRSRRPHTSPRQTAPALEAAVLALRDEHPAWGGRKLAARLRALGWEQVPAPSTVTEVLRRHQRLAGRAGEPRAYTRFEHSAPNALWQMDFKGHVRCGSGRCHPLTVLDDHSRYVVALRACADERTGTVRSQLTAAFRRYGLPEAVLVDNGSPWADPTRRSPYTPLGVWLLQLGVQVRHSRPYHPQTLGKDERFHRTLRTEVLALAPLSSLDEAQGRFDRWRVVYNEQRPHEALGLQPPASRYRPSERPFPERLRPPEYAGHELVRKVQDNGRIDFLGRRLRVPRAFAGLPVALRSADTDGCWEVYFGPQRIASIHLSKTRKV